MPAAAHKAAISFGLVYIPVALFTATKENRVSFNQLHADSNARVRYKKIREDTGEEVTSKDIVKGYEYSKGQYIVLTDDEIERMKTPKDKAITILQFVPRGSIDPLYYEKSYYVVPEGSDKAYNLLLSAMQQQNVMAVARTVLGTSETMLTLSPHNDGIILETLHFYSEVKPMPKSIAKSEISDAEMKMGVMLIDSMRGEYQPENYRDEYADRLKEAIQSKIEGRESVAAQTGAPNNVVNLMDALQRSLEHTRAPKLFGTQ